MEEFPCSSSRQSHMNSLYYDSYSFPNMENDLSDNQSYTKTHNMVRWKSGKRVDPRLLVMLESFTEIYLDRREFFKKIFQDNYEELFKKIGDAMKRKKEMKKARSMPRSRSMRAIRQRGIDDELDGLRLDRFKVKAPNVIVAEPDDADSSGQGDQTQATQGSTDAK